MLRVTTIHANTAGPSARYYTRYLADDGPQGEGVWLGRRAADLGLSGSLSTEDMEALLSGHDPVTGTRLGYPLVDRYDSEGKLIAASFLDNFNKIVLAIRDQESLIRTGSASGDANAGASTKAGAPVNAGQMFVAKIANVKVYASASRDSKVVATLNRSDELVASGEVKDGFMQVDAANFSGWVQRTLLMPISR